MARRRADYIDKAGQLRGKSLTAREIQVAGAILAGYTTNERIGALLVVETKTVQAHLHHIYSKTGAADKAELLLMVLGRIPCAADLQGIIWE